MGNKGFEAALAAVEMASLKKAISRQLSAVTKTKVPRSARNDKRDAGLFKIKVNFKGNGQECPFQTCKSKGSIKSGGAGVRGSHFSQKTREMGHPP
jgi:hypothetical protein